MTTAAALAGLALARHLSLCHDPIETTPFRTRLMNSGIRRIYVAKSGLDSNDGLSPDAPKATIVGGLKIAQAGDVVSIGPGVYFERPAISNKTGPILIIAEEPGTVTVSDEWRAAYNATQQWERRSNGIFRARHGDVYMGEDLRNGDFLFRYKSEADLAAATVAGKKKPSYGCAYADGYVYVRLRDNADPNGIPLSFTETFGRNTIQLFGSSRIILDGLRVEGAGNSEAINFDNNCTFPEIRNCISSTARHLVRHHDDAIVHHCDYSYAASRAGDGCGRWMREVAELNGNQQALTTFFPIFKNYFVNAGNAYYEGGIQNLSQTGTHARNRYSKNRMHRCFEGLRLGHCIDSEAYGNFFKEIGDNDVEFESWTAAHSSRNNHFYLNMSEDCHGSPLSWQGAMTGDTFVYRNVIRITLDLVKWEYCLKTLLSPSAANTWLWNNWFENPGAGYIWYDYSNGSADVIEMMRNNVFAWPVGYAKAGGPKPKSVDGNVCVLPAADLKLQGPLGLYAGRSVDDLRCVDFVPCEGSPLIGRSVPLVGAAVGKDRSGIVSNDAGPFPMGFDWRPLIRADELSFDVETKPERWTYAVSE